MKRFFLFVFTFFLITSAYAETITFEVNGRELELAPNDIDGMYTWYEARSVCSTLEVDGKKDWFLASKEEMKKIYELREEGLSGFANYYYWSSTEYDESLAWYQNLFFGHKGGAIKDSRYYVRCVRLK
jgi:hypothetical protein